MVAKTQVCGKSNQIYRLDKLAGENKKIAEITYDKRASRNSCQDSGMGCDKSFTSSGVCSPRSLRPSNKKAMEFNSTDCLSQYAVMSFLNCVLRLILKKTSLPSYNQNNITMLKKGNRTAQVH